MTLKENIEFETFRPIVLLSGNGKSQDQEREKFIHRIRQMDQFLSVFIWSPFDLCEMDLRIMTSQILWNLFFFSLQKET